MIPILDLNDFSDEVSESGSSADAFGSAFVNAYEHLGFAYIINHGVDQSLLDAVFAASKRFHALPESKKLAIALDKQHRGYIAIDTSTNTASSIEVAKRPNQSASFIMLREDAEHDPAVYLSGPNQWPELVGFREACEAYVASMSDLGRRVMALALKAIGAVDNGILARFEVPTLWLRLLYYPPQPPSAPDDLYGSAPHTDFGCLTFLAQDDVGGLQVRAPNGDWLDVPPIEGAFVVNVGDMLHRLSNGKLLSTPHRVINRSGRERYSIPFFFDPHVETVIAPLAGTGPAKFEPTHFGTFLRGKLEAVYDAHRPDLEA